MSDLISRQAVIDIVQKEKQFVDGEAYHILRQIEEAVYDLPTAYDLDKVVKRLDNQREGYRIREIEMLRKGYEDDSKPYRLNQLCFTKAIDIVKRGGKE